ncbi:MAG: major capsid protein E [Rhodobiaceae bacterium]|nr:MAG: major capsid protein E [Rhodobiaceae bacterium]
MATLDIFNDNAFSMAELTNAIRIIPNKYGFLNDLGIFVAKPIRSTIAQIEYKNGVLNVLPQTERGGPASKGTIGGRNMRAFEVPNFAHEDSILSEEVQNVRAFGTESEFSAVQDLVNDKMITMADKHFVTKEHLRWGALKGVVVDGEGNTIYNYFDEFDVTQKVVNFNFTDASTDIAQTCRDLLRYISKALLGESYTGKPLVVCSPEFWDAFIAHPDVKEAYAFVSGPNPLRDDVRNGFTFHDVTFVEHDGDVLLVDGETSAKYVPEGEAILVLRGTRQLYQMYYAPADFMETVNTPGLTMYAKHKMLDYNRGVEIHTQTNPLPIVTRPSLLVKFTFD